MKHKPKKLSNMALDAAKKDYYTSAEAYRDEDGNMKQFTFIDHDVKTKITPSGKHDIEEITKELREYRQSVVKEVLLLSASLCPMEFVDFTIRGEGYSSIQWNELMITDEGLDIWKLVSLRNILENRQGQLTRSL